MNRPKFIMLMGLPGSGKSTFRTTHYDRDAFVHLSTDDLVDQEAEARHATYNDVWPEYIKEATTRVNEMFQTALKSKLNIVWDQTNLTAKKRLGVLRQVPKDYLKMVIYVQTDEVERQRRLLDRPGKNIPAHIDKQMIGTLVVPTIEEGWDSVLMVRN